MTTTSRRHPIIASVLAASLITSLVVPPAVAEPFGSRLARDEDNGRGKRAAHPNDGRRDARKDSRKEVRTAVARPDHVRAEVIRVDSRDRGEYRDHRGKWGGRQYRRPIVHGTTIYVVPNRVRHYRNVVVVRPYGRWYPGYGFYRRDADAWRFLAFTAITLAVLNNLNEHQQRTYEQAQITAAAAPIGQTITWNDAGAAGTVTPLRDGTAGNGAYCREFRQTVTIAGQAEEAYGTACRKPDGSWEVVSSGQ